VIINIAPLGPELEENFGLDVLFSLRGVRQAPADVVIVSIDRESAEAFNLPEDPRKWPRSIHRNLVEKLYSGGAAVIAFDVTFTEKKSSREDNLFAEALKKTRNTVLCEALKVENVALGEETGLPRGELNITKVLTASPQLLQCAAASAPFPIPKVPNKVTQYWTFSTAAADKPTLPVVAFQIYAMQAYDDFINLLNKASPYQARTIPANRNEVLNSRGVENLIHSIRYIFQADPSIAEKMREELRRSISPFSDTKKYQIIDSLISIYADKSNSQYLNFYGPARTIKTVPYYKMLGAKGKSSATFQTPDVSGKAVFVGLSQLSPIDQKESFYTVYSESGGVDLSGIEIMATAFANLTEDVPVQPINFRFYLALVFSLGAVYGFISKKFTTGVSFYSLMAIATAYLIFSVYEFKNHGIWYPVITPVFLGPVAALFSGLLWNYYDVKRERQNIRKALGFYLPDSVADQLAHDINDIHSSHKIVFGICLSTDAAQYSSLAETMDPKELGDFMNRYYKIIFEPIKQHSGIVSDVVGDSVMAVWIAPHPEKMLKHKACMAALDISKAIQRFNEESEKFKLPTRIGLHSGNIMIGNIGAVDHYEYRPVGDIVNTSSRIEGLNKYLSTHVLVSEEVISHLEEFLTRKTGEFKLAGKTKPVAIYELVCKVEDCDERQMTAYKVFADSLDAFARRSWDEAIDGFQKTIEILGEDGPSSFYIKLCKYDKEHEPGELWNGVVHMDYK
jgi:adenylate cyclase